MSMEGVRQVADQADKLGTFIIDLIGGEPLLWPHLDRVIETIGSERFHITVTTNGWMLEEAMAKFLKQAGVDKVSVSLDSGFKEEHDTFRQQLFSFRRAVEAIKCVKDYGMRAFISTVATHQNVHREGFVELIKMAEKLGVGLSIQCATASGGWSGNTDVLIDADDAKYLEGLRDTYPLLRRDIWPTPGVKGGCPAGKRQLYVMASGDVCPCLFMHVSFGNVLKEPLTVIQQRMMQVRELQQFSPICLVGEDRPFIAKYMTRTFNEKSLPVDCREVFGQI